jgi:hypothetical protein
LFMPSVGRNSFQSASHAWRPSKESKTFRWLHLNKPQHSRGGATCCCWAVQPWLQAGKEAVQHKLLGGAAKMQAAKEAV